MGFIFVLLAIHPEYQQRIQEELDQQRFDTCSMAEWTAARDCFQALQKGWTGAVQKEVASMYGPTAQLSKEVREPTVVTDTNGTAHPLPTGTLVQLNQAALGRHPSESKKRSISPDRREALLDSPALDFNPGRWLNTRDQ